MKTTKTFEIEIERHNVTPAQFLAYLRSMRKKYPEMANDFDLNMFSREGWNFDYSNALPTERPCESERGTDKPYQKQTYIRNFDGTTYNEIIEFDFDDEKTGHGYYYTVQIDVADEDREANTAENVAAIIRRRAEQADRQEVKAEKAEREANEAERRGYTAQWWIDSKRTEAATLRREAAETRAAIKATQEAQEAPQEAPAAEAEQQPTETENAPQAATQTAELDTLKAIRDDITTDPNPDTIRAALDAIRQQDPETELTEQDSPRAIRAALTDIINGIYWDMAPDITAAIIGAIGAPAPAQTVTVTWSNGTRATYSAGMLDLLRTDPAAMDIQDDETGELIYIKPDAMEAEQAAPAPDPDAVTLAPAEAAQVWTEDGKTVATATEAATVAGIIRMQGGYRERIILLAPHEMTHGETWNAAHKVVYVTETTPGPDGYRAGCAVDIVTRSIVG